MLNVPGTSNGYDKVSPSWQLYMSTNTTPSTAGSVLPTASFKSLESI
jgi:hypothetical protein